MVKSSALLICFCYLIQGEPVSYNRANHGLTAIPDNIPEDVTHLDLSNNIIQWITQNMPSSVLDLNLESNVLTQIPDYIFITNPNLETLNLRHNQIHSIAANAFAETRITVLKLGHNVLPAIPSDSFAPIGGTLTELSLRGNKFKKPDGSPVEIHANAFANCPRLRTLDLESNHISRLSPGTFTGTIIEVLRLSYNDLIAVPSDSLTPLKSYLRELDLSDNEIKSVEGTVFVDFPALTKIDMSGNRITHIEETAFLGTPLKLFYLGENALSRFPKLNTLETSLEGLYLEHNNLRGFSGQELRGFEKLRYLSVTFANISRFPDLGHVKSSLQWLNMKGNPFIENVPQDYFEGFQKLTYISVSYGQKYFPNFQPINATISQIELSSNEIRVVPGDALGTLKRLNILHLDENQIMQFPNISSIKITNLSLANNDISFVVPANMMNTAITNTLDLSNNNLKTFPSPGCTNAIINRLNLGDNPLECDCKLRWMKETDTLGGGMTFGDSDRLCVEPAILVLATWGLMQHSDFQCLDNREADCDNILAQEDPAAVTDPSNSGGDPSGSVSSSSKFTNNPASSSDTETELSSHEYVTFKGTESSTKSQNSAVSSGPSSNCERDSECCKTNPSTISSRKTEKDSTPDFASTPLSTLWLSQNDFGQNDIKLPGTTSRQLSILIGGIGAAVSVALLIIAITIFIVMRCRRNGKSKAIQHGQFGVNQSENGSVPASREKNKYDTVSVDQDTVSNYIMPGEEPAFQPDSSLEPLPSMDVIRSDY